MESKFLIQMQDPNNPLHGKKGTLVKTRMDGDIYVLRLEETEEIVEVFSCNTSRCK